MEYFKSISSAASAVLSKGSPLPNFTIGEKDLWFEGRTIWSLHDGVKRDDSTPASILVFDSMQPAHNPRRSLLPLAKNALRKLRTVRHPDVLRLLDSAETPTAVYIAVERVRPLGKALEENNAGRSGTQREEWIGWGLSRVTNALKFLNVEAASTHGNIRTESIFTSLSGEWRLGGFEVLSSIKDENAILYNYGGLVPDAGRYASPEVKQGGWGVLKGMEPHVYDSYSFALLILEAYNGARPPSSTSGLPPQGKVPASLYNLVHKMMTPNAKSRMPTLQVLEAGNADGGFFKDNRLVKVAQGLESFVLASEGERATILKLLKDSPTSFPPEFLQHKVLPSLVQAFSFTPTAHNPGGSTTQAATLLPLLLQLGAPLTGAEWTDSVAAPIIKAYTSPDRAMRMALLDNLELYAERFENRTVVDKVWPNLVTGFSDSVPVIREATVKSILLLAPKLSERILNNDLLRQLAKTQVDPEPGIRTNTTILLGRLSKHLTLNTRRTVLIPAFGRSLRDPFVHARVAGLMALMATGESYDKDDTARKVLPSVTPCLVDKEKIVREQASKGVAMFLKRIEEEVATMPDSVLPPEGQQAAKDVGQPSPLASSTGGAAAALAGWAMSSAMTQIGKHLGPADLQNTAMDGRATPSGSAVNSSYNTPTATPSASTSTQSSPHLRALSSPNIVIENGDGTDAWDVQGDLMDVNDDAGDWTSFETAPTRRPAPKKLPMGSLRGKVRGGGIGKAAARPRDAASAVKRQSFAVVADGNDDDAWGNTWGEDNNNDTDKDDDGTSAAAARTPSPSPAAAFSTPVSAAMAANSWDDNPTDAWDDAQEGVPTSQAPSQSARVSSVSSVSSSTGTPVGKAALASGAPAGDPEGWDAFDDEDDEDEGGGPGTPGSGTGSGAGGAKALALTKEEKRAELARKREERRVRMAQLKEEKAQRLGAKKL